MKHLALFALCLAAVPVQAQSKRFALNGSVATAKAEALTVKNGAALAGLKVRIETIEGKLTARDTCQNAGRAYLPSHGSANGSGCVDTAALSPVIYQTFTNTCTPNAAQYNTTCIAACGAGWLPVGTGHCSATVTGAPWFTPWSATGAQWQYANWWTDPDHRDHACQVQWHSNPGTRRVIASVDCYQ